MGLDELIEAFACRAPATWRVAMTKSEKIGEYERGSAPGASDGNPSATPLAAQLDSLPSRGLAESGRGGWQVVRLKWCEIQNPQRTLIYGVYGRGGRGRTACSRELRVNAGGGAQTLHRGHGQANSTVRWRNTKQPNRQGLASWYTDVRGALLVEYSVLIGAVAIGGSIGLVILGAAVVRNFDFVRGLLLCPIP